MFPKKIESLWTATSPETHYPELKQGISVDVMIVGAGIAGLNVGYFLVQEGLKVAVIDSQRIATGTSGNTTAKITSQHSLKYTYLKKKFGTEKARIYADSNQWAVDEFERIIDSENISCDFTKLPAYVYSMTEDGLQEIKAETGIAQELGLPATFVNDVSDIPFRITGAVKFDNQAYFHPRKYLLSLAEIIQKKGGYIFEQTEVSDIIENKDISVITTKGEMTAKHVIIATNYPVYDKNRIFNRIYKARSYGVAVNKMKKIPKGMFIGMDGNKLSFRPHRSDKNEWLIIGGQSHNVGEENGIDHFSELEKSVKENFGITDIDYRWAAEDSMTEDKLPYIGKMSDTGNIFVTTGYAKWGMTISLVSAKILADLITGKNNAWADLYSPKRITGNFFTRIKNVFLKHGQNNNDMDFSELAIDSGKIISLNGKKIAVYKDEKGSVHTYSAVCTHLGCTVGWNEQEKTWDCPCHDSHFAKDGSVVQGPAVKPLENIEI
jgi:glycine/D-amino acid oxidase-like deaminating enzyme/nitrite reductase/ring-hydroxylating ferredoxin subunit